MNKNTTLAIYHAFPKPDNTADIIENRFDYWRRMSIEAIELDEIQFLGATASTTNEKSKPGNYYFVIDPIQEIIINEEDGIPESLFDRKAIVVFKPEDKQFHIKKQIIHPEVSEARNKAASLLEAQRVNKKEHPNNIQSEFVNPSFITDIKKDIQAFFLDMSRLELESKKGPRRACFINRKGYYYVGICKVDYCYPESAF